MEEQLMKATHQGILRIGTKEIDCAVLEDGTRVITQTSFLRAINRSIRPTAKQGASFEGMPAFLAPSNLKPFINQGIIDSKNPIIFKPLKGFGYKGKAFGYKAELLPKVCYVYLDAKKDDKLLKTQENMVKAAEIIIRGLATVGIIALVDEATGYQEVRDRLALQKILDKYITDEWAKWTKTFPNEFYKELFRLKNIPYPPNSKSLRKPSYVGHWTNDVIYSRLAPGVLNELRKKNPRQLSGSRKRKFHQFLTRDIGHPALKEHLSNVIFLMKGCTSWNDFKRRLSRAKPKYGDTFEIPFDYDGE